MVKRVTSVLLCLAIVFTIVITDYKKVSAFEWAIPTITFDVALPFLMGLLGVTYATSDSTLVPTEDEFFSYAEEQNIAGPDVRAWLDNVFSGTLNQASNVWTCFKSWVQSFIDSGSSETVNLTINSVIYEFLPNATIVLSSGVSESLVNNYVVSKGWVQYNSSGTVPSAFAFFNSNFYVGTNQYGNEGIISDVSTDYVTGTYNESTNVLTISVSSNTTTGSTPFASRISKFFGFDTIPYESDRPNWSKITLTGGVSANIFDSLLTDVTNLDLLEDDAVSTTIPDVVSLPWQNVGDTTQDINQTIEGLIEAVNEGLLDLSDLVTTVQGLLDVITVDTTTDIVVPEIENPDTSEPTTSEDVVNQNISNTAFVLEGLQYVFPFCIPFDLYKFATLLVAQPVAPVLNYPIYNPANKETYTITIDFSEWEEVVIIGRYIFDFLFIIGLILITYKLIGG